MAKFLLKVAAVLFAFIVYIDASEAQPFSVVVNGPSDICGTNSTYLTVSPSGGISFRWFNYNAYPWGLPYTTGPVFYYPETGAWMCEVTTSSGVFATSPIPIRTDHPYITAPFGSSSDCNTSYVSLREEYSYVNNYSIYFGYQWKKDGVNVSGATNSSCNASASGNYTCVVTLGCGTGTSNPVTVQINSQISSNTSITASGATTFCSGGNVILSVPNTSGWTYQWKRDGNNISGANTFTYTATLIGNYTCAITNICNSVTTAGVMVTVETLPAASITANGSTTFCAGSSVTLTANSGTFSYQWKNGAAAISGATLNSYTATSSGNYTCEENNSCGPSVSNSITVTANSAPEPLQATISAGGSTTFCNGGNVVLTAYGSGFTYQWKRNGSNISGATSQSYTATESGDYICEVSNGCGSITANTITVAVNQPPTSVQSTINAGGPTTFCSGSNVVLTVGTGGFSYQWKNGGSAIAGATNQGYTAATSGSYICDVSNSCGTVTSNTISVTVNNPPTAGQATINAGGSTAFCSGGNVVLSVATAGLSYQWRNGATNISGATLQSYTATTSGAYTCSVSNSCGPTISNSITVTVNTAPTSGQAIISAGGPTTICNGGTVLLTVATAGLTYQWKKGNTNISGATQQSYTVTKAANYKCVVSNSCGSITSNTITVTVISAPSVSISQSTCSNGAILLTCTSNPNSGVSYQWQKGTNILNGATNSTYSAVSNGTYKCTVTITAYGCSKTSSGSKVTINCKSGEEVNDNIVIVYPNPSADYFNINTKELNPESEILIYDLTGRLVERHTISGDQIKVGETLTNGIYFLKILSNNQVQQVIKLVKNQ